MKYGNLTILAGYKPSPLGIIPEDWEVKRLGEACDYVDYRGKSPNKTSDGVFLVTAKNIREGYIDYNISKEFIPKDEYEETMRRGKAQIGDVLITTEAPLGHIAQIDNPNIALAQRVIKYRGKTGLRNTYLKYYLMSDGFQTILIANATGSTALGIKGSRLHQLPIIIPSLKEQDGIITNLELWDTAISKQMQLIEKLTLRKKGLMHQLLTGKKRLKGFEGEWKDVRLGDIGDTYSGLINKNKDDFEEGNAHYIPYMNVFSNEKVDTNNLGQVKVSVSENQTKVKYGDIFFTVSSETPEEVGMASVLLYDIENTYLNSFCFGYRLNGFETLLPVFASYLLRGNSFRKEMYKIAQGSTRFNISKNEVMDMRIALPSIDEQNAIASVLVNADKEIEIQKQKLAAMQEQKKGLMQVLLTGKRRMII